MATNTIHGRYVLRERLGSGRSGVVWSAEDNTTGALVALKLIQQGPGGPSRLPSFRREMESLRRLDHPGAVRVLEWGAWEGSLFIAMELMAGPSLEEHLAGGVPLETRVFLRIARPLVDVLAGAHRAGIVHGDVKPANVFLVADGAPPAKIADFGTAALRPPGEDLRHAAPAAFHYMAPERSGMLKRPVDARGDLYSLGTVFHRMLAGAAPYGGDSAYEVMHRHIATAPPAIRERNPGVPAALEAIVRKLLEKNPEDRYPDAETLGADLAEVEARLDGGREDAGFVPGLAAPDGEVPLPARLVMRDYERQRLRDLFHRAERGEGTLAVVRGAAGSGKSRLLADHFEYVVAHRGLCLECGYEESAHPLPYAGAVAMLRSFLAVAALLHRAALEAVVDAARAATAGRVGLLEQYLPGFAALLGVPADAVPQVAEAQEGRRLENLFVDLFLLLGDAFPAVVLLVDDAQWIDSGTLLVVDALTRAIGDRRLVVVLGARGGDNGAGAGPLRALLESRPAVEIPLAPYSRAETTAFVGELLGERQRLPGGLGALVHARTGGNAFAIVAFLGLLLRLNLVGRRDGWRCDEAAIAALPFGGDAAGLVDAALDGLHGTEERVLRLLSVFGTGFLLDEVLPFLDGFREEDLFEALRAGEERGILLRSGDGIRFTHALVHEACYRGLDEGARRAFHLRIARHFDRLAADDPAAVFKAAAHYQDAGDEGKTLEFLERAGDEARARRGYRDAIQYYELCSARAGSSGAAAGRLVVKLGETLAVAGDYRRSIEHLERALAWAGGAEELAALYHKLSYPLIAEGQYGTAIETLGLSLALSGERVPRGRAGLVFGVLRGVAVQVAHAYLPSVFVNPRPVRSGDRRYERQRLLQRLGWVCFWAARRGLLVYAHFRALNIGDRVGVSEESAELLLTHCTVLGSIDGPVWAVRRLYRRIDRVLDRVKAGVGSLERPTSVQALYLAVSAVLSVIHRPRAEDPDEAADRALAILRELGTSTYLQEVASCVAQVYELHGRYHDLLALGRLVVERGRAFDNRMLDSVGRLFQGIALQYLGEEAEALTLLESALRDFTAVHDLVLCQYARIFLFRGYCRAGRDADALAALDTCLATIRATRQTHPLVIARIHFFLAEELLASRAPGSAGPRAGAELDRRLKPAMAAIRRQRAMYPCHAGAYLRLTGLYHWLVAGDRRRARAAFEGAVAGLAAGKQRHLAGLACRDFGEFLAQEGDPRAAELRAAAERACEGCGVAPAAHRGEPPAAEDDAGTRGASLLSASRELDTVIDIGKKIGSVRAIDELVDEILGHALALVGAEQGALLLYEGGRLVTRAARDLGGGDGAPPCQGVVARVDGTWAPVIVDDARADVVFRHDPTVARHGLRSLLCVPLASKGQRIGALYLSNHHVAGLFTGHELELANALAGQAAVAIENSRLFGETERLRAYLTNILDSLPGAVIAFDGEARITHLNTAAGQFFPELDTSAVGRGLWAALPWLECYRERCEQTLRDGTSWDLPQEIRGDQAWWVTITPLHADGVIGGALKINDVTEIERTRQHLVRTQKMEAIATLAGGLTHDFNNLLTIVLSAASYLGDIVLESKAQFSRADVENEISIIRASTESAAALVKQLMTVSARRDNAPVPVDLKLAVKHVLKICEKSLGKGIAMRTAFPKGAAFVTADPLALEQVLINLAINGAHAMTVMRPPDAAQGGTLTIAVEAFDPDAEFLSVHARIGSGPLWRLTVEDTGVGMGPDTLSRIFDPYYTTKGAGTGLGLTMVYNIVSQCGGHIEVHSEPGVGTRFTIFFPAGAEAGQAAAPAPVAGRHSGEGTVLLIEDETSIRLTMAKILEAMGYTALTAATWAQAEALFRERHAEVTVVIADMLLPDAAGARIVAGLLAIDPRARILVTSGAGQDGMVEEALGLGALVFLQKPYSIQTLGTALAAAKG